MKITITEKELMKGRDPASASGALIDELAYSAGEATQEDIDEEGHAERSAIEYTAEHFDYESELLANTKSDKDLAGLASTLEVALGQGKIGKSKHAGAYMALHYPLVFADLLEAYTDECKAESAAYFDSPFLNEYAPQFAKEIQDGVEANQKQYYKEWLYGDHRDYAGVLSLIAKFYGASEALDYDEKTGDSVVFTYEDGDLANAMNADYFDSKAPEISEKEVKAWLIEQIHAAIDTQHAKKTTESAKRRAERERIAAYKAKQAAEEEQERKKKLEKLIK